MYRTEVVMVPKPELLLMRGCSTLTENTGLEENTFWLVSQVFFRKHLQ